MNTNLAGQSLGQYQLRELLGMGGMGAVYRAYQSSLNREVAVKILPAGLAEQPGYIDRFTREAKTSATLEHPHIVPIVDYGTQRDMSFIVMRLLTGGTLAQRLSYRIGERNSLPSLGESADLLKQLASALDYAHQQGVIHRDIKPNNVMFDNQGNAYVVDFGIAKLTEATAGLTGAGMVLGTPTYMSPEQWRSEQVTPSVDQYALAVLAYALVTGRVPFEASTPYALMNKHLHEEPTPPQTLRTDIPEAVALVLARALSKKPADRFPTVTAFAQAFDSAIHGQEGQPSDFFTFKLPKTQITVRLGTEEPVISTKSGKGEKGDKKNDSSGVRSNPLIWIVALLVIGLIALLAVVALSTNKPPTGEGTDTAYSQTMVALAQTQTAIAVALSPSGATPSQTAFIDAPSPQASPTLVLSPTSQPASPTPEPPTPEPPTAETPIIVTVAPPTVTPSRTPIPTPTLPGFTANDFSFDLTKSNRWSLENMSHGGTSNAWVIQQDPYMIYTQPLNVCLDDFDYFSLRLGVPLDVSDRSLQVFYALDGQNGFNEERSFRIPLKTTSLAQRYDFPVSNLNVPPQ